MAQVFTPDGHVRLRHPRVGAQHEDDGVRRGQQAQRELGLGPHRVQARGVDDDQTALQQRVRVVDQRMAPGRHVHTAVVLHGRVVLGLLVGPQAQGRGAFDADALGACDGPQGLRQRHRVTRVEWHVMPVLGAAAQFGQAQAAQPGLDGQQLQLGRQRGFMAQFHRTHGGAPRAGGQHAPPGVGEENGVDEFRLATRKLGHEGQHQLVRAQAFAQRSQQRLFGVARQPLGLQAGGQRGHPGFELPAPAGQGVQAMGDGTGHGGALVGVRWCVATSAHASSGAWLRQRTAWPGAVAARAEFTPPPQSCSQHREPGPRPVPQARVSASGSRRRNRWTAAPAPHGAPGRRNARSPAPRGHRPPHAADRPRSCRARR